MRKQSYVVNTGLSVPTSQLLKGSELIRMKPLIRGFHVVWCPSLVESLKGWSSCVRFWQGHGFYRSFWLSVLLAVGCNGMASGDVRSRSRCLLWSLGFAWSSHLPPHLWHALIPSGLLCNANTLWAWFVSVVVFDLGKGNVGLLPADEVSPHPPFLMVLFRMSGVERLSRIGWSGFRSGCIWMARSLCRLSSVQFCRRDVKVTQESAFGFRVCAPLGVVFQAQSHSWMKKEFGVKTFVS